MSAGRLPMGKLEFIALAAFLMAVNSLAIDIMLPVLDYIGVDYKGINVLADSEIRQGIKDYSNWPTIPQLYVKGEFIGGCDIIREMFQAGELQQHLQEHGVAVRAAS